jgi:hypothetical protein
MTRFLGTLVVLLAIVAGIGFYRGWFEAQSSNTDGQTSVKLTVDKDAVTHDEHQVTDLAHK